MFNVISTILYVAVVLIAVLLICLVLVQPSKGGGLGSAFGGIGESVFGAQAMSQLSKVTVVLLTLFFVLTLILAVMTGHRSKASAVKSSVVLTQQAESGKDGKATPPPAPVPASAQPAAVQPAPAQQAAPAPVKTLSSGKTAAPAPAKPAAAKPAPKAAPAKPAAAKPAPKAAPAKKDEKK